MHNELRVLVERIAHGMDTIKGDIAKVDWASMTSLTKLDLSSNAIRDDAVDAIAKALTWALTLSLDDGAEDAPNDESDDEAKAAILRRFRRDGRRGS